MDIRAAAHADIGGWIALRSSLWPELPEHEHKKEMGDYLDSELHRCFLAVEGGRSVAMLEASIRPTAVDCLTTPVGYVEGWYVEEEWRNKGIGKDLMKAAEAWFRWRGCREMASDSELDNTTSFEAHLAFGFEETSRLIHYRKALN